MNAYTLTHKADTLHNKLIKKYIYSNTTQRLYLFDKQLCPDMIEIHEKSLARELHIGNQSTLKQSKL